MTKISAESSDGLSANLTGVHAVMVAVHDIHAAVETFGALLADAEISEPEEVEGHGFLRSFVRMPSGSLLQLMQPIDSPPLSRFLEKRGEGLYGLVFHVEDLDAAETSPIVQSRFDPVGGIIELQGMRELVLNPRSVHGVLTVLRQT